MNEILIETRSLRKSFWIGSREIPVLQGIDLRFHKGEFTAILGVSGSGKTTLLHLLGLLDDPSGGELLYHGEAVSSFPAAQKALLRNRKIGFVFQFYHLIPELTALQNTILPQMIYYPSWQWPKLQKNEKERAEKLLVDFGLKERLHHRPNRLSGGEKQRVALARAMMAGPEVLLCDEPTGNLDSKTGAQILDILEKVHQEHRTTFLIVTHDSRVAERCGRVIHLTDGKITQS